MNVKDFYAPKHITSVFGDGRGGGRKHRGIDLSHSTTPGVIAIPALIGGKVVGKLAPASWHGFGHQVTIESQWGGRTIRFSYAHLSKASPLSVGQSVSAGTIVGYEGRTGSTTGNCVHIELHNGSGYINPAPTVEAIRVGSSSGGSVGKHVTVNRSIKSIQQVVGTKVDGLWGPNTEAAVKAFQSRHGLKADGIWGPASDKAGFSSNGGASDSTKSVQSALNKVGYTLAVDGIKGPATTNAIRDFQRRNGLVVDGLWGPKSQAKLEQALSTNRSVLRRSSRGNEVKLLQQKLGVGVDGIFGPNTETAVKNFQKKNGLTVDGIVGRQTWLKLGV